ncbi:acyltransferase family protein, partial [uncultured Muribaculum sp.]
MIGSLQSLRGIFAIMIFLHHFPINGKGWFDAGGPCGVDFFLILSGFVLCVGYENKVLSSDFHYRHFIFKRLIRVYPLHIFCLLNWLIIQIIATLLNFNVILKLIPNIVLLQ